MPARSATWPSSTTTSSSATRASLRRRLVPAHHHDVALRVQRPAARGHLDRAVARRRQVDAGPGLRRDAAQHLGRVWMAQAEQALGERVVAAVEVAEHDEEVAARDGVGARRRDLEVGGVVAASRARQASSPRSRRAAAQRCCSSRCSSPSWSHSPKPAPISRRAAARAGPSARARCGPAAPCRGRTRARTTSATRAAPTGSEVRSSSSTAGPSVTSRSRMQSR